VTTFLALASNIDECGVPGADKLQHIGTWSCIDVRTVLTEDVLCALENFSLAKEGSSMFALISCRVAAILSETFSRIE
jgi:hypothetical protein